MKKILPPRPLPPTQPERKKQQGTLSACLGLPYWLNEICFPKKVHHHFWLANIINNSNKLNARLGYNYNTTQYSAQQQNKKNNSDLFLLDLKKAFDNVLHEMLWQVLAGLGVKGCFLRCL